jgi:hypothetical protein
VYGAVEITVHEAAEKLHVSSWKQLQIERATYPLSTCCRRVEESRGRARQGLTAPRGGLGSGPGHYLGGWSDFEPDFWLFYSMKLPFPELFYSISYQPLGGKTPNFVLECKFSLSRRIFGVPRTFTTPTRCWTVYLKLRWTKITLLALQIIDCFKKILTRGEIYSIFRPTPAIFSLFYSINGLR